MMAQGYKTPSLEGMNNRKDQLESGHESKWAQSRILKMPRVGLLNLRKEICPSIQVACTAETTSKSIIR